MGNSVNQIMTLAKIRRFVDENMPKDLYVNVYEEIRLPSPDGDYADYDALIIVDDQKTKKVFEELFSEVIGIKVVVINL